MDNEISKTHAENTPKHVSMRNNLWNALLIQEKK